MPLFIKLVHAVANAQGAEATHRAFMHRHMLPTAVLQRSLRGEDGWQHSKGQRTALGARIRHAHTGNEWNALCCKALRAYHARSEWNEQHRHGTGYGSSAARRSRRAKAFCADPRYGKAMRSLHNAPLADVNDSHTIRALRELHPLPPRPISPIPEDCLPPPATVMADAVEGAARGTSRDTTAGPHRSYTGASTSL